MEKIDFSCLANLSHSPLCDSPITMKELSSILATLQKWKSQGLDEIPPTFLRSASEKIKRTLANLQWDYENWAISQGLENWRTYPSPQKGDPTKCGNYRLLAIHWSVFRKLFCTIADKRMRQIIELDEQNGFSWSNMLWSHCDCSEHTDTSVKEALKRRTCACGGLQQSLRHLSHSSSLAEAQWHYGVRGGLLRVVESMYPNTEACLFVNGVLGESFRVTNGVARVCPQPAFSSPSTSTTFWKPSGAAVLASLWVHSCRVRLRTRLTSSRNVYFCVYVRVRVCVSLCVTVRCFSVCSRMRVRVCECVHANVVRHVRVVASHPQSRACVHANVVRQEREIRARTFGCVTPSVAGGDTRRQYTLLWFKRELVLKSNKTEWYERFDFKRVRGLVRLDGRDPKTGFNY